MGAKRGQLFIISIVFLVGMIFIVQQALFNYSSINMASPMEMRDTEIFSNVLKVVNKTLAESYYCNETKDSFVERMEELKASLLEDYGREYSVEIVYMLDCSKWDSVPPDPPPLNVSISVGRQGSDTYNMFQAYHLGLPGALTIYYFDADNDGYGTAVYRELPVPGGLYRALSSGDCDDASFTIHPDAAENSPALCTDGFRNDCAASTIFDYDTSDRGGDSPSTHGINSCPVGVTAIYVNDTTPDANSGILITCTSTVSNVNSVFAYIDENMNGIFDTGDRDCGGSPGWSGTQATFANCDVGSAGTKSASCGVYSSPQETYDRSFQSGSDVSIELSVSIAASGNPTLIIGSVTGAQGTNVTLPLTFMSGTVPSGFMLSDIRLPYGFSYLGNITGPAAISSNKNALVSPLYSNEVDLRLIVDNTWQPTIPINDGIVVWFRVHIGGAMPTGDYQINHIGSVAYAISTTGVIQTLDKVPGTITVTASAVPGTGSAFRSFSPSMYTPGSYVNVTIEAIPDASVWNYTVRDRFPSFYATDISHGGWWDAGSQTVYWPVFYDNVPRNLTYRLQTPCGYGGPRGFTGVAYFNDKDIPVGGVQNIDSIPSPPC